MPTPDIVLCAPVRRPIGSYGGSLKETPAAAVAGGMENMDQTPYLVPGARWGQRMEDAQMLDSMLRDGLHDAFSGQHSGWHTEDLVGRYGITREDQDR